MPLKKDQRKKANLGTKEKPGTPRLSQQPFTLYADSKGRPMDESDGLNIEAEYIYVEAIDYASAGQISAIKKFIAQGGDVNERNEFGTTAVLVAASRNDLPMLKLLVEKGHADLTVKDATGKSAMDWAVAFKNEQMKSYIDIHSDESNRLRRS